MAKWNGSPSGWLCAFLALHSVSVFSFQILKGSSVKTLLHLSFVHACLFTNLLNVYVNDLVNKKNSTHHLKIVQPYLDICHNVCIVFTWQITADSFIVAQFQVANLPYQ